MSTVVYRLIRQWLPSISQSALSIEPLYMIQRLPAKCIYAIVKPVQIMFVVSV